MAKKKAIKKVNEEKAHCVVCGKYQPISQMKLQGFMVQTDVLEEYDELICADSTYGIKK